MREHPDYDAVVISTLRPGMSKWLDMDIHHRVERKTNLPVIHVCEGGDQAWRGGNVVEAREVPIPPPPPTPRRSPAARLFPGGERASRWPFVVAAMFVYLIMTTGLALGVNRTFFLTDAIAVGVFTLMIVGVWYMERARTTS